MALINLKISKQRWILGSLAGAIIICGVILFTRSNTEAPGSNQTVSSYDECVSAGNPVQESYPSRCIDSSGQVFTQTITGAAQSGDDNQSTDDKIVRLGDSGPTIQTSADSAKIRSGTYPSSFTTYLEQKLKSNEPDANNCISSYIISQVSSVNVAGGVQTVDATTMKPSNSCGGGASVIWYLKDGKWYETGLQAQPDCSELAGTTIYSEFIPTCFDPNSPGQESKNPNGSITDA